MTRHPKPDVAQVITDLILEKIAAGTAPWLKPWTSTSTRPLRHNGVPYSGINTFFLWAVAESRGYASPYWMTFRQAGIHPDRISIMRNTETPMGTAGDGSRPIVSDSRLPSGNRRVREANAGMPKGTGNP
jgi:hypothetical protein